MFSDEQRDALEALRKDDTQRIVDDVVTFHNLYNRMPSLQLAYSACGGPFSEQRITALHNELRLAEDLDNARNNNELTQMQIINGPNRPYSIAQIRVLHTGSFHSFSTLLTFTCGLSSLVNGFQPIC